MLSSLDFDGSLTYVCLVNGKPSEDVPRSMHVAPSPAVVSYAIAKMASTSERYYMRYAINASGVYRKKWSPNHGTTSTYTLSKYKKRRNAHVRFLLVENFLH